MQNGRIQEGAGLIDRERSSLSLSPPDISYLHSCSARVDARKNKLALGGGVDCHGEEIRRRGGGGGDGAGITHSLMIHHA